MDEVQKPSDSVLEPFRKFLYICGFSNFGIILLKQQTTARILKASGLQRVKLRNPLDAVFTVPAECDKQKHDCSCTCTSPSEPLSAATYSDPSAASSVSWP
jgi:hypothetical protein